MTGLGRAEFPQVTPRTATDRAEPRATPELVRARGFGCADRGPVNPPGSSGHTTLRRLEDDLVPPLLDTAAQIAGDLGSLTPS